MGRLILSSSFRCDQIHQSHMIWVALVVLLKSDLDVQQTHLKTYVQYIP
jgi:hypothetical protein